MSYPVENETKDCSSDSINECSMFLSCASNLQCCKVNFNTTHNDCSNNLKVNNTESCIADLNESVQNIPEYNEEDGIPITQPKTCDEEHFIKNINPTEKGPILMDNPTGIASSNSLDLPKTNLIPHFAPYQQGWTHGNLGNAMLGLDQKDKALHHLMTAFHMSARYSRNPLAVGRAVSNLGNVYQAIGNLTKTKEYYEIALGHAIYGNDLQGQGRACGNIGNVYMLLKEPVKAVHYYTETLRLSTDKNTKITGYHNRGCARFAVAECIIQGKKPKELVTATTPDPVYDRLTIKLTDEVITTDPVQEKTELSAQSASEQWESSMSIKGKKYDRETTIEIVQLVEALPFL